MHSFWPKIAISSFCSLALLGCNDDFEAAGGLNPNRGGPFDATVEFDTQIAGSVGDGPVVNATIVVRDNAGAMLQNSVGSQLAGYNVQVKTRGRSYPLFIEATGGTDLVTNRPLDFMLHTAVLDTRRTAVANLNPYTTLAIATARRMSGGSTPSNIRTAETIVVTEFNSGLTSLAISGPMTTPINDSNLVEIVKSSESLAEVFRRVHGVMTGAGRRLSIDAVIDALGADLVDGKLDGRGATGTDRHISAATVIVNAQVLVEAMTNTLQVDSRSATAALDAAIKKLASRSLSSLTASAPITAGMVDSARIGVAAANAIAPSAGLTTLQQSLGKVTSGMVAAQAATVLPSTASTDLGSALLRVALGSPSDLDKVNALSSAGTAGASLTPPTGTTTTGTTTTGTTTTGTTTTGPATTNTAPTISGTPATSVLQGQTYRFTPTASDANGDALTFSIANRPRWASFNAATGELSGRPGPGDVGSYTNISIAVSDGKAVAQLRAFSITVQAIALGSATMRWVPPTENVDGTPLTDLAGYKIYRGTASKTYSDVVTLQNPGITTYVVEGLGSGTHYFAITAVNSKGVESVFSNEGLKTIP